MIIVFVCGGLDNILDAGRVVGLPGVDTGFFEVIVDVGLFGVNGFVLELGLIEFEILDGFLEVRLRDFDDNILWTFEDILTLEILLWILLGILLWIIDGFFEVIIDCFDDCFDSTSLTDVGLNGVGVFDVILEADVLDEDCKTISGV